LTVAGVVLEQGAIAALALWVGYRAGRRQTGPK